MKTFKMNYSQKTLILLHLYSLFHRTNEELIEINELNNPNFEWKSEFNSFLTA